MNPHTVKAIKRQVISDAQGKLTGRGEQDRLALARTQVTVARATSRIWLSMANKAADRHEPDATAEERLCAASNLATYYAKEI
jgi:hypothetical protein